MKKLLRPAAWLWVLLAFGTMHARAQAVSSNGSLRHEIGQAIERAADWLVRHQTNGHWSTPEQPAVSALALVALRGQPLEPDETQALEKGYEFLLRNVQPDGSIHGGKGLANYNTSLALLALTAAGKTEYRDPILRARRYLIGTQIDQGEKGVQDSPFDGGVGYGSKYEHSDMGNTVQALEALYHSRAFATDVKEGGDLNWAAAIHFLQNCQNLPSHNRQEWASDDPANRGGFIYYPGHSMAGQTNLPGGRVALRSYGSISYAGLLSYVYANLEKDDPRVLAVFEWLRGHYTLDENPGMGPQGLYYYFHTMAKALSAYGVEQLPTPSGPVRWREQLALRLLNLQRRDGSWENDNGRWWEKDPALVTAYGAITLEIIAGGL